ncbi:MBL fold metallo-hydrolase [Anaerosacchariphilus polymeriproducens]|uniref:MBL fold metallo-hydrolase n=1 Tax=Anaerosacchariphilus polymeriproducens TaxID=1812858 RepID=A0A371ATJ3_9FIRM|nr:MBL fold metallo-hydrolase [Anaerosacchariphilus polymeriproducens]RDU22896.1 MBL fold metallo-hydrolase [Anaerosacchariphilus polymeriproducens]
MRLCSVASGSSGNCIYAGVNDTHVMIDAGISGKKIEQGLNEIGLQTKDIQGIVITHEHIDHVKGLGVLARKFEIPIYGTRGTIQAVRNISSLGRFPDGLFHEIKEDESFQIHEIHIKPFAVSHDAVQPVSYVMEHEGSSFGVVTDLGMYDDYTIEKLKGLDALLLEANHDVRMLQTGKYPYYLKQRILGARGHLSNEVSGQLLCEILHDKLKYVLLGHLSKENNYEELAYETVCSEITLGDNQYRANDFSIQIAKRDGISELVEF